MEDDPVPIIATFFPVKSTSSLGQVAVCSNSPSNDSSPSISGLLGTDRQPVAKIQNLV